MLADDPMLTCRLENSINPVRIICDSHLRTPLTSKIVRTAVTIPTIIASSSKDQQKIKNYEELGCQVLYVPEKKRTHRFKQINGTSGSCKDRQYFTGRRGFFKLVSTGKRYCSESSDLYSTQTFWRRRSKDTGGRKGIS